MIDLERLGSVVVLHWHDHENRFNRQSVDALDAALDEVVALGVSAPGGRATS